jgi:hypothetical protein
MSTAWRRPNPHARQGGLDKVYTDMGAFINSCAVIKVRGRGSRQQ